MNRGLVLIIIGLVVVVVAANLFRSNPASDGVPMVSVTVPEITGSVAEGAELFNANCATCHGNNAAGKDGSGPPLVHVIYEPNHHGDDAIRSAVQNGARQHHWTFGNMAPVPGLSPGDVDKIIAFVRTLQQANGIE